MKVTVCFNSVWVVVPCGSGRDSVHDLMSRAALKYSKAVGGQCGDSWVTVHSLKSSDGGLLDPDDRVCDVVDDREQLVAEYHATTTSLSTTSGGGVSVRVGRRRVAGHDADGTSASSDDDTCQRLSASPHMNGDVAQYHCFQPFSRADIEVTDNCEPSCSLQVRRGSESALNQLPLSSGGASSHTTSHHSSHTSSRRAHEQQTVPPTFNNSKRWSAAPVILDDDIQARSTPIKSCGRLSPPVEREAASGAERDHDDSLSGGASASNKFTRDSSRLSMQFNTNHNSNTAGWADAADKVVTAHTHRWEPVGRCNSATSNTNNNNNNNSDDYADHTSVLHDNNNNNNKHNTELVILDHVVGPLGIHVVPAVDGAGLSVQRVESGGAVRRDGRVCVGDVVVAINGTSLRHVSFHRAQDIFTSALNGGQVSLLVDHSWQLDRQCAGDINTPALFPRAAKQQQQQQLCNNNNVDRDDKGLLRARVAAVPPTKKPTGAASTGVAVAEVVGRASAEMLAANTRRPGVQLSIELVKAAGAGLGFSLTTRDNPTATSHPPIYVKNILSQGAAIEDGRLKPGDRVLSVDGHDVTVMSQQQVVELLRAVACGRRVQLLISRQQQQHQQAGGCDVITGQQEECSTSPRLPRPLVDCGEECESTRDKEIIVLDIPVHDSERAGLGVSVKGKTTTTTSGCESDDVGFRTVDAGIFIKNVICGGAASKDGRLQKNDQLVEVNSCPLLALSNSAAMDTLRRAMFQGPQQGVISLIVARRRRYHGEHSECDTVLTGNGHDECSGRDSVNSMLSSSSGELLTCWRDAGTTAAVDDWHDAGGGAGDITVSRANCASTISPSPAAQRYNNLALDILTNHNNNKMNLRNESYCRATHDASTASAGVLNQSVTPGSTITTTTTTVLPEARRESLLSQTSVLNDSTADVAYASQTSLEHTGGGFTRDQVGRQSISEKRHASKDARSTDTYQRNKKARDDRTKQRQLLAAQLLNNTSNNNGAGGGVSDDVGPGLGMKKSSSLESLQTMVHELAMDESGGRVHHTLYHHQHHSNQQQIGTTGGCGAVKVVRGRGCNDSFRAAVDRSYDAPLADIKQHMETLCVPDGDDYVTCPVDEHDCGALETNVTHFSRGASDRHSSVSSGAVDDKRNANATGKRRSNLLKGLGSMFGFGRSQRKFEETGATASSLAVTSEAVTSPGPSGRLTEEQLRAQQAQLSRLAVKMRNEQQQQQQQQQQWHDTGTDNTYSDTVAAASSSSVSCVGPPPHANYIPATHPPPVNPVPTGSRDSTESAPMSRSERLSQLRHFHQQQHADRSHVYRTEQAERNAEQRLCQTDCYPNTSGSAVNTLHQHTRSHHRPTSDHAIINNQKNGMDGRAHSTVARAGKMGGSSLGHQLGARGGQLRSSEYFGTARRRHSRRQHWPGDQAPRMGSGSCDSRVSSGSGVTSVQLPPPSTISHHHFPPHHNNQHNSRQHQQLYHSQRGNRPLHKTNTVHPADLRPIASYYEYESVQAMMPLGGARVTSQSPGQSAASYGNRSLPRHYHERTRSQPTSAIPDKPGVGVRYGSVPRHFQQQQQQQQQRSQTSLMAGEQKRRVVPPPPPGRPPPGPGRATQQAPSLGTRCVVQLSNSNSNGGCPSSRV